MTADELRELIGWACLTLLGCGVAFWFVGLVTAADKAMDEVERGMWR